MSESSDYTFWLIVVAIVAFAACRIFSYWCDCQIQKKREETQAEYYKSYATTLQKYVDVFKLQRETHQEILRMIQRKGRPHEREEVEMSR